MFEGAFPQFSGFQIAACFGVITACLGVNAACFPGRPKNWFLRGANTGKLVWFRWWGLKVICCNLLAHVHEIEYRCMWAVKWVASNPQMVDRDAPITNLQGQQTKHIKSKVVWFSVTATFYQLRRVLDNAACSGKCRQNFSSIPLRPKFWQHESIGIYIYLYIHINVSFNIYNIDRWYHTTKRAAKDWDSPARPQIWFGPFVRNQKGKNIGMKVVW